MSPDPRWGAMAWLDLIGMTQKPERPVATPRNLLLLGEKEEKKRKRKKKRKKNLRDPGPPVEMYHTEYAVLSWVD